MCHVCFSLCVFLKIARVHPDRPMDILGPAKAERCTFLTKHLSTDCFDQHRTSMYPRCAHISSELIALDRFKAGSATSLHICDIVVTSLQFVHRNIYIYIYIKSVL